MSEDKIHLLQDTQRCAIYHWVSGNRDVTAEPEAGNESSPMVPDHATEATGLAATLIILPRPRFKPGAGSAGTD